MGKNAPERKRRPGRPGYVIGPATGGSDVQLTGGRPDAEGGRGGTTRRKPPRRLPELHPTLPVRMYQTDDRLMIAAPMPGLEPQDIAVSITGSRVVLRGAERGPHQHDLDLLLEEWTIGPYYRELDLPVAVDGELTNATFGNGVLVLSMPKARQGEQGTAAEIHLEAIEATRGERTGHTGRAIEPAGRRGTPPPRRRGEVVSLHGRTAAGGRSGPVAEGTLGTEALQGVHEGMRVYDRDDVEVGSVRSVYLGSSEEAIRHGRGPAGVSEPPTRGSSPLDDLARAFDTGGLPEEVRERLRQHGFIRIAGGLFAADRYALPEHVARVTGGAVRLRVARDELITD